LILNSGLIKKPENNSKYHELFYKVIKECDEKDYLFNTYALLCTNLDIFIENFCKFAGIVPTQEQLKKLECERIENLKNNPAWIGNRFEGCDTFPGRHKKELKPKTIQIITKVFKKELDFLKKYDHPSVRHFYD